jgi:hypothetical protein
VPEVETTLDTAGPTIARGRVYIVTNILLFADAAYSEGSWVPLGPDVYTSKRMVICSWVPRYDANMAIADPNFITFIVHCDYELCQMGRAEWQCPKCTVINLDYDLYCDMLQNRDLQQIVISCGGCKVQHIAERDEGNAWAVVEMDLEHIDEFYVRMVRSGWNSFRNWDL